MSTLADLWHSIADRAMVIDSLMDRIAFTLDLHDPRDSSGSGLNGGKVSGGESLSPQDRAVMARNANATDVTRARIEADQKIFTVAVGEIMSRAHSKGAPSNWDEAVQDAALIDELGLVDGLVGPWGAAAVKRWIYSAGDQLDDIDTALRQYVRRAPNAYESAWSSQLADGDCCPICLEVEPKGRWRERKAPGRRLCNSCAYLRRLSGGTDPSPEVVGKLITRSEPRAKVISTWLQSLGIQLRA